MDVFGPSSVPLLQKKRNMKKVGDKCRRFLVYKLLIKGMSVNHKLTTKLTTFHREFNFHP